MKTKFVAAMVTLCLVSVLALASSASAEERAIQPGDSYSVEVDLSFMEMFSYSWSCDVSLDFLVEDPTGGTYTTVSDSQSFASAIVAFTTGTYTITWTNDGTALAHLTFDLSGAYDEVEEGISTLIWALVIVGIIIVAVIVIIIIVVVMGGKRATQQPVMMPPPQTAQQVMSTGHCPTCGNAIDPNGAFCSRCGTRFR